MIEVNQMPMTTTLAKVHSPELLKEVMTLSYDTGQ
jgi:hypothetical protein